MTTLHQISLLLFASVLLTSCGHTLKSESGLYDVKLKHYGKLPVDGIWTHGKGNPYAAKKGVCIYVNPLDVSKVRDKHPEMARVMVYQMQDYVVQAIAEALRESNAANNANWRLTTNLAEADMRIDMALVHFVPQRPGLKLLSLVGKVAAPVPAVGSVLGTVAEGDICLECTMRDCRTNKLLLAFKDSNRKKARFYTEEAYQRDGNADVNLQAWARDMARLIRNSAPDLLGDKTLEDKVDEMSIGQALKLRLE